MKKAILLIVVLSFFSCNNESPKKHSLDGVWQSVGYGRLVKIENGEYIMAETTSISCIPLMEGEIAEFSDALSLRNDTLTLKDGINVYYFTRLKDAPAVCKKDSPERIAAEKKANNPEHNFEVLWQTFNDHYAYFELRKINWDSMYTKYRPMITSETTQIELYKVLDEMLAAFNDGHIGLDATDEVEEAAAAQESSKDGSQEKNNKEKLRNYQIADAVANKYIPEGTAMRNNNLRWGVLEGNIGYFQMNQMMGLSDYGISDTLAYRDYWMAYFEKLEDVSNDTQDELDGLNPVLDIMLNDLGKTEALIIDVRFNGGGKDEVGMALLDRLNSEEKTVFTKKGKLDDGFTPINKVLQGASATPYSKPVYLLISTESASATEIMALSALSLPNITLIGSNTEGVFSDILDRQLPNGWEFGLSSEVYESMDGKNYEGIGIPPDVEVGYPRDTQLFLTKVKTDLETTGDVAIEKALERAKTK